MSNQITMGNEEFILYIRKTYPDCSLSNSQLGKRVWSWIEERDADAEQANSGRSVPSLWGDSAANLGERGLPKTATQLTFDRDLLPALYTLLDHLGKL